MLKSSMVQCTFFTSSSSFQIISAQSVSAESVKTLGPFVPGIWSQLFKHCECQEEGTRNVVAECLGKLCLIEPEKLLGELRRALTAPSALLRTTVVTCKSDAYRFPIDLGNFSHSLPTSGRRGNTHTLQTANLVTLSLRRRDTQSCQLFKSDPLLHVDRSN